ncbi:MAG: flagellin [Clostridiaceae bacterium]|nr:flagellin [Clostridiaceae bacterium]
MRINNNITALNTFNKYTSNTQAASKAMEKLSSGLRINRAADDAAGLSISEKMRSQIAGLDQSNRNVEDGISYIQTAEGALEEVSDMLVRMKELSVESSNGTYSTEDRTNIQSEVTELGNAIKEIATTTKFNGISVFGTAADQLTTDPANQAALEAALKSGGSDAMTGTTTIAYGADAAQSVTVDPAAGFMALVYDGLNSSGAALKGSLLTLDVATSDTTAKTAVGTIDAAIGKVNAQRATYGAQQNKLSHIANNLSTTNENISAAESNIRDVDMASEMSEYTKNNILVQASTSMLAQANAMPQNVLSLLQ